MAATLKELNRKVVKIIMRKEIKWEIIIEGFEGLTVTEVEDVLNFIAEEIKDGTAFGGSVEVVNEGKDRACLKRNPGIISGCERMSANKEHNETIGVNVHDFTSRPYKYIKNSEMDEIRATYTKMRYEDILDINDPKYQWETVVREDNDAKYGRWVISKPFKIIRTQTMGEFYGNSPVD